MEKYAKLMKGLEMCAGPDCCKDGCPYYGETTGSMTCRARLLADAAIAINNEQALHESADEELRNAVEKLGKLDSINTTICAEREKLREELATVNNQYRQMTNDVSDILQHRNKLIEEITPLHERCQELTKRLSDMIAANKALIDERDAMREQVVELAEKLEAAEDETDRPSVCDKELMEEVGKLIAQAKYQEGKADALEWFLREWFREGGFQE